MKKTNYCSELTKREMEESNYFYSVGNVITVEVQYKESYVNISETIEKK